VAGGKNMIEYFQLMIPVRAEIGRAIKADSPTY